MSERSILSDYERSISKGVQGNAGLERTTKQMIASDFIGFNT